MIKCKFLKTDGKCIVTEDFYPTGASVMGYCMATIENRCDECNWFTEVE